MSQVRCKEVFFYSPGDEDSFFVWAKSIPHVKEVYGELNEIVLSLHSSAVPFESLRELIALLYRYNIPMQQLAAFETEETSSWLRNKECFWHENIFGG